MGAQSDSKFNASAHFAFVTRIGNDLDKMGLWRALQLADKAHPWVSRYLNGELAPSIQWSRTMSMREGGGIDRIYEQEIRPAGLLLHSQLVAYENYANNLAKTLAELRLPGVIAVKVRVEFQGTMTTYHPN